MKKSKYITFPQASDLIEYVAEREKAKSEAVEGEKRVGVAWRYSAKGAKYATLATVKVSGFVANRVGKITKGMADSLAKQVRGIDTFFRQF